MDDLQFEEPIVTHPTQSPLFHAENAERYSRQTLIAEYERIHDCRLVVVFDQLMPISVSFFEELIFDANREKDLHVMLVTPGGDGETAVRLVRSCQERCNRLTVLVPDQAKSAGTIFALGAHGIVMGPTSDLGPIDPQLSAPNGALISAKDIIAAVAEAEAAVQAKPETFALHAGLLADVTALMVQQARSALARSADLMKEAIASNPDRNKTEVDELSKSLLDPLIDSPRFHGALLGANDAKSIGLPVERIDPMSDQWKLVWRLWTKYLTLRHRIYEGTRASKIVAPW